MVVRQSVSIGPASSQHLVRDLGLLFRAGVILAFGDEDRHVKFLDQSFVRGDSTKAGEPVEGVDIVEGRHAAV